MTRGSLFYTDQTFQSVPPDSPCAARNRSRPASRRQAVVCIGCRHAVISAGLERVLEKVVRVYREPERPKGDIPFSVLLYASGPKDLAEEVKRVQKLYPGVAIVVFGPRTDLPLAHAALKAGTRGYVHAEMKPEQLVRALELASQGALVAPRKLIEYLLARPASPSTDLSGLSPRQWEILELVADGLSNAQIAERLYLSQSTIKQHLRTTYKLLKVRNRLQAATLFRQSARTADRPPLGKTRST